MIPKMIFLTIVFFVHSIFPMDLVKQGAFDLTAVGLGVGLVIISHEIGHKGANIFFKKEQDEKNPYKCFCGAVKRPIKRLMCKGLIDLSRGQRTPDFTKSDALIALAGPALATGIAIGLLNLPEMSYCSNRALALTSATVFAQNFFSLLPISNKEGPILYDGYVILRGFFDPSPTSLSRIDMFMPTHKLTLSLRYSLALGTFLGIMYAMEKP